MKNIEDKIKDIIFKQFKYNEKNIKILNNTSFRKELEADSLDIIEIIMELEEEFKIDIPDEDIEKLDSIDSIIKYLSNKNEN